MASGGMKSFYRQKKSGGISKSKAKASVSSKKKALSPSELGSELRDDHDKHEDMLRHFDLNVKYGPCMGISRLERLERAKKFGMNPPGDIESLLRTGEVCPDCVFDQVALIKFGVGGRLDQPLAASSLK